MLRSSIQRNCLVCGGPFTPKQRNQAFDSNLCRYKFNNAPGEEGQYARVLRNKNPSEMLVAERAEDPGKSERRCRCHALLPDDWPIARCNACEVDVRVRRHLAAESRKRRQQTRLDAHTVLASVPDPGPLAVEE